MLLTHISLVSMIEKHNKNLDKYNLEDSIGWKLAIITKLNKFSAEIETESSETMISDSTDTESIADSLGTDSTNVDSSNVSSAESDSTDADPASTEAEE